MLCDKHSSILLPALQGQAFQSLPGLTDPADKALFTQHCVTSQIIWLFSNIPVRTSQFVLQGCVEALNYSLYHTFQQLHLPPIKQLIYNSAMSFMLFTLLWLSTPYASVFLQVSPPKFLFSHIPATCLNNLILSSSPKQSVRRSKNHEAPHYAIFSILLSLPPLLLPRIFFSILRSIMFFP